MDRRARRDQRAGADLADAEHAGERRADHAVADVGAHLRHAGARGVADGALRVELRARDQLLAGELVLALVKLVGFVRGGLRLFERGLLLTPGERDQRRARGHHVAAFEMHLLHRLADLGGDGDGFARFYIPQREQRVAEGLHPDLLRGHRNGTIAVAALALFGAVAAACDGRAD